MKSVATGSLKSSVCSGPPNLADFLFLANLSKVFVFFWMEMIEVLTFSPKRSLDASSDDDNATCLSSSDLFRVQVKILRRSHRIRLILPESADNNYFPSKGES